jgi:hypothetical protein
MNCPNYLNKGNSSLGRDKKREEQNILFKKSVNLQWIRLQQWLKNHQTNFFYIFLFGLVNNRNIFTKTSGDVLDEFIPFKEAKNHAKKIISGLFLFVILFLWFVGFFSPFLPDGERILYNGIENTLSQIYIMDENQMDWWFSDPVRCHHITNLGEGYTTLPWYKKGDVNVSLELLSSQLPEHCACPAHYGLRIFGMSYGKELFLQPYPTSIASGTNRAKPNDGIYLYEEQLHISTRGKHPKPSQITCPPAAFVRYYDIYGVEQKKKMNQAECLCLSRCAELCLMENYWKINE